ncbi:MAG TPA: DUF4386 domain-containing protein [Gemmatimonadaceae bacterium]|nr:DUF4386 domain-containing protein [Gemmatimonadaceae bacterium]
MTPPTRDPSVRDARVIGALYLVLFVLGPLVFLGGKGAVFVPDDPAATVANIDALGTGYRHGLGIEAAIILIEVLLSGLLYAMFRRVDRGIAFAAGLARFGEAVIQGVNLLTSALVLGVLEASVTPTFASAQRDLLVQLFQQANGTMVLVWGLFFGLHVILLGWLVFRSSFLPRWLGVLLLIAGAGYLAQSLGVLLVPSWAAWLDTLVIITAVPGELCFTLWLLVKGVRSPATATAPSP